VLKVSFKRAVIFGLRCPFSKINFSHIIALSKRTITKMAYYTSDILRKQEAVCNHPLF
jgi:hypothetical protein